MKKEKLPTQSQNDEPNLEDGKILAAHFGYSANCSSMGSFIDFLFLSSVVGAAALSSLEIFLKSQKVKNASSIEQSEQNPSDIPTQHRENHDSNAE